MKVAFDNRVVRYKFELDLSRAEMVYVPKRLFPTIAGGEFKYLYIGRVLESSEQEAKREVRRLAQKAVHEGT